MSALTDIDGLREKLAALGELEYEQKRQTIAADYGLRASVLDKEYRKVVREAARRGRTQRPIIDPKSGDLPAILAKSWTALSATNDPVRLVDFGGAPARIVTPSSGLPRVEHLDTNSTRFELANAAYWESADGSPSRPDRDQIEMLLASPETPLPPLTRIVTIPIHDSNGKLVSEGYNESGLYYAPSIIINPVSAAPIQEEIDRARTILWEPIQFFPFGTDADKASAIALMILPFTRELFVGPVPMTEVSAPDPGSGKGLLAKVCLAPFGQYTKIVPPQSGDEAEWRKLITTSLATGVSQLYIDNLDYPLHSAAIASLITEDIWSDRLLCTNRIIQVRTPSLAITVNNGEFSTDILRRLVPSRIDPRMEDPQARDFSAHFGGNLEEWVRKPANRSPMVWAILTLISAWLAAGRPAPTNTPQFGSFEGWRHTVGGILQVAGITGLLTNLHSTSKDFSRKGLERLAWKEFTARWWAEPHTIIPSRDGTHRETVAVKVKDLLTIARSISNIPLGKTADMREPNEQSMITSLGIGLGKRLGKTVSVEIDGNPIDLQVHDAGAQQGAHLWKLVEIVKAPARHDAMASSDGAILGQGEKF